MMPDKDIHVRENEVCVIMADRIVTYSQSQDVKNAVFDRLIDWYFIHGSFNGGSIIQCDDLSIDAFNVLAQIADDIIQFDVSEINNENH